MSRKFSELKQQIKQKGVFDLQSMHSKVIEFLKNKNYGYSEKDSTTKTKQNYHEVILIVTANREVDELARYDIKVEFFLLNAKKSTSNGKRLDKGDLDIRITGDLIIDYKHEYASRFKQFLLNLYLKYMIPQRFEDYYETQVFDDATALCNLIKKEMNLAT
jgi:uncharacterized NAD(P)/FAD-binding protein YdhS